MLYRPKSFKNTARALTTVAALAGASVFSAFPANAQQMVNASPCDSIKNHTAAIKCEIKQADERIKDAKAEAARARSEGAAAQSITDCVQFLTTGVKSGMFAKTEILEKAAGKLNDTNACSVSRQFGFGRKAEVTPAVRLN